MYIKSFFPDPHFPWYIFLFFSVAFVRCCWLSRALIRIVYEKTYSHTHTKHCVHKRTAMFRFIFLCLLLGYAFCIRFKMCVYFREYISRTVERTFIILTISKLANESANISNKMNVHSSIFGLCWWIIVVSPDVSVWSNLWYRVVVLIITKILFFDI